MTLEAVKVLERADVIIGYSTYINLIRENFPTKQFEDTGMKKEVERCKRCIELYKQGKNVAVVSSGDSGIYGMAGLILELSDKSINVEVIPGITSAVEAASVLGAPLMNDFAVISMSDLLTPIDIILKRIKYAAMADLVICIYNPRSNQRKTGIEIAFDIIKEIQGNIVVGIVKNAGRDNEYSIITDILNIDFNLIDMTTMVIIGNSFTYLKDGKMITKRGYDV